MPRRKAGALLPIEIDVLRAAAESSQEGRRFHGFGLAEQLSAGGRSGLIGHGTLYKALGRLLDAGLLVAEWEDPDEAERAGRPRRRLYEITAGGRSALAAVDRPAPVQRLRAAEAGA